MVAWALQVVRISDLKDHAKNPRRIDKDQLHHLEELIKKFGLIDKPIVNLDLTIIGGHQRLRILKKMKVKTCECWVPDELLSQEDIDRLCIGLNLNQGAWDWEVLANSWEVTDLLSWGFTEEQLLGISEVEKVEGGEEEDGDQLEPTKDPVSKTGDLYILGDHRLLCGDSTMPDDVAKLLDGGEPILMVTDPPYGVEYDASWRKGVGLGKKNSNGKVQNDDRVNWSVAWHLFPGSVAYVWSSDKMAYESVKSLKDSDYEIIGQIIWSKQHFALSRGDYHSQHEPCWYAVKKGHTHNWQGSRKESTLWEISNQNAFGNKQDEERTNHSTQKPLECMARPIRNNSAIGEGVYDPFVGSGTTIIAAEQLGRKCYAMEIDPCYCDMVVQRWIKYREKEGRPITFWANGREFSSFQDWESNRKKDNG